MKSLLLLFLSLTLISCASYQPGKFVMHDKGFHPKQTPITAKIDQTFTNYPFIMVDFSFGNESLEWKRIKKVEVLSVDGDKSAKIVVGKDLSAWAKSMSYKIQIDNHNKQMLIGSIAAVSAGVAAYGSASGQKGTALAGMGGLIAVGTIDSINKVFDKIDNLERSALVPEAHLYTPFSIPPKLVTKKWILIQRKDKSTVKRLDFKVIYESGKTGTYFAELGSGSPYN